MTLNTLLDQLTEAATLATSGPWRVDQSCPRIVEDDNGYVADLPSANDAHYVSLANPTNIMRLVTALREAREIISKQCTLLSDAQNVMIDTERYLNWHADDLTGDDCVGDGRKTMTYNRALDLLSKAINAIEYSTEHSALKRMDEV